MAKKEFKIAPQTMPTAQQAYSMLLGDKQENQIVEIPINLIDEIDNQPHKVHEDKIERISESMKVIGQIEPVIVVKSDIEGRYTLLAGRHRKAAAVLNGKTTIKAVVSGETNEDLRRLILLSTNNDRNNDYLPSERAFAYKEQNELMKKLGYTKTTSAIAEENGTNRKSVHKYLQLTKLDSMLLHRVDKGEITVGAGYELSFLSPEKQKQIGLELFNHQDVHIDNKTARQLRNEPDKVKAILSNDPKPTDPDPKINNEPKPVSNPNKAKVEKAPYKFDMCLASILFNRCNTIFVNIIKNFYSTNDICNYIKNNYGENKKCLGDFSNLPLPYNNDELCTNIYSIEFHQKKCVVTTRKSDNNLTYEYSYSEIDSICRDYLRWFIKTDQIIHIIKK